MNPLTQALIHARAANGITLYPMHCAKCKQKRPSRGSKIKINRQGQRKRICAQRVEKQEQKPC